jgi:type IV secretion system protein VirB4
MAFPPASILCSCQPRRRTSISEGLDAWLARGNRGSPHKDRAPVRREADLDQALRGTLASNRQPGVCRGWWSFSIRPIRKGCMRRLARWCEVVPRRLRLGLRQSRATGRAAIDGTRRSSAFDVTEFLDHRLTRAPITLYLFHLVRQLLDGRRLVCWMDEFWRCWPIRLRKFRERRPEDLAKTQRRDVPRDAKSERCSGQSISRTLVEQTPTKVFFPNADAIYRNTPRDFGLTEREFKLIKVSSSRARACSWSSKLTTAWCVSSISRALTPSWL